MAKAKVKAFRPLIGPNPQSDFFVKSQIEYRNLILFFVVPLKFKLHLSFEHNELKDL